jgi:hypothetical protein
VEVPVTHARRISRLVLLLPSVAVLAAGCAAAAATPTPPTPTPAAPSPSSAGPTSFAEWTARQGFGGSSGLGIIRDNLLFVVGHRSQMTSYDVDSDKADVTNLAGWLDLHPATACWADYHQAVRDGLARLADGYEQMRPDVEIGHPVPDKTATDLKALADSLVAMPQPAGCP